MPFHSHFHLSSNPQSQNVIVLDEAKNMTLKNLLLQNYSTEFLDIVP